MKKKVKRICCVDSLYCLFLYFLICGINDDDIFILGSRIPEDIRKKLPHIFFPDIDYTGYYELNILQKIKKRFINITKRIYRAIKTRFLLFIKTINYNVKAYGQGHLEYSFPIYEYDDTNLLEDGFTNYFHDLKEPTYNENALKTKIINFLGYYVLDDSNACLGPHKKIKKVYLTQNNVPDIIKNKTEVINIQELWDEKTEYEKDKILDIYGIKEIINVIKDNDITLLLTQCLSEDDLIPLDEEINIYRYLIERQGQNKVIIKTHPRENKDYTLFFPEMTIIDKPFPLELLKCIGLKINKIITVSSNAATNFVNECEIELYTKKTSSKELNKQITAFNENINSKNLLFSD